MREMVLVVEDEHAILLMIKRMLEGLGYHVLTATSASEALRLVDERTVEIHALLADVVMPEMNGPELAGRLAKVAPGLKRLFMSSYTADVISQHGVINEGLAFLSKPFSREDLATKLRQVLDGAN